MEAYTHFADYYDRLTTDVDYPRRAQYIRALFNRFRTCPDIVLDLACGTGSMTIEMARAGYQMIGVDISPQMLSVATQKSGLLKTKTSSDENSISDILWICQDMCSLDLYGTVDAAICCLDSLNHLPDIRRVGEAFESVSLFLNPGGYFIFDLNTEYKLSQILGDNTFVYDEDEFYCVWQNNYQTKTKRCYFDLTFFEPDVPKDPGNYRRFDEHFSERVYSSLQIRRQLEKAGLEFVEEFKELTFDKPDRECERIVYIARKRSNAFNE